MKEQTIELKEFVDYAWKEIDNGTLVHALHSEKLGLSDVPTLIVGIGGTGVEAARTVKDKIEQHYHPNVAKKVEYLFIDTDENSVAGLKGSDTLVIQSADTAILLREFKEKNGCCDITLPPEITQWLDPEISPFRVMNGAAGIRQAGRLILFLNIHRVYHVLEKKLKKIAINYDLQNTRIKVHIFTGIGGGTGSGMFIDISYLIRHICSNCEIQGFVFMPDVSCMKPGLPDVHRRNIKRNAFAALREIEQLMTLELYGETFKVSYPGGIANISTNFPIFNFCVLVGSMQDGRKALTSEKEVFQHVAEYLLLELQQKEKNSFDFESHKSNLCVEASKNYYFTKYVAVDAHAKYLPIDHYYSWWIKDVFQRIYNGLQENPFNVKKDSILKEVLDNRNGFWNSQKDDLRWYSRMRTYNGSESTIRSGFKNGSDVPNTLDAKLNLLGKHAEKVHTNLTDQLKKNIEKGDKAIIGPFFLIKWYRFIKYYKKAYQSDDSYKSTIEKIVSDYSKDFLKLIEYINEKCQKYTNTKLSDSAFEFAKKAFQKLKTHDDYEKSVNEAASKIVDDFLNNPGVWLGKIPFENDEHLSGYVASLVGEAFDKSGCTSIFELLVHYSDKGISAVQEQFNEEVLDTLHAAPLWPIKSGVIADTLPNFSKEKMLAHSNAHTVQSWINDWIRTAKDKIADLPNQLHERVAMGVYASGYSLRYYEGIDDLEREYNTAANRAGLNLFSGDLKNWNRPFSPIFRYDWSDSVNSDEQEKAREYRKNFDKATETKQQGCDQKIIYYDKDLRKFVYKPPESEKPRAIGNIEGDEKTSKNLATELFIRMNNLREQVEKDLLREHENGK